MRSPLFGLVYYLWLRTRFTVLCLAAASVGVPIAIRAIAGLLSSYFETGDAHLASDLALMMDGCLIIAVGSMMFSFLKSDVSSESYRANRYLMTMPARTGLMARSAMLYTVLVVAVVSCGAAYTHAHLFGRGYIVDDAVVRKFPLICVSAALWMQSTWLLDGLGNEILICAVAACVWGLGLVSLCLCAFERYAPAGMALCLALIPIAYGISCAGISGFRYSRGQSIRPWLSDVLNNAAFRTTPFRSAESALSWYTWRRYCRPAIIGFACGGLPLLLLWAYLIKAVPPPPGDEIFWKSSLSMFTLAVAWGGAFTIERGILQIRRGRSLLIVQPVRSDRMAGTTLFPLAGTLVLLFVMTVTCIFAVSHLLPRPEVWDKVLSPYALLTIASCFAVTWFFTCYGGYLFLSVVLVAIGFLVSHNILGMRDPETLFRFLGFVLAALGIGGLVFGWHKRYMKGRNAAAMLATCGLVLLVVLLFTLWEHADPGAFPRPDPAFVATHPVTPLAHAAAFAWACALILFAGLPFVYLPARIDHYRHR